MGRDINKELEGFNRTPALEDVIWEGIRNRLSDMHTMLPGKVVSYDRGNQTAVVDLQYPDFDHPDPDKDIHRIFPRVRIYVAQPQSSGFFIHIDLPVGSYVMVFFCERSLSEFKKGRKPSEYQKGTGPVGYKFGIQGAFCIPGMFPRGQEIGEAEEGGITIGSNDTNGMRIHLEKDKVSVLTGTGLNLELEGRDAEAKLTLGAGVFSALIAEKMQVMWTAMAAMFAAHTHQTPAGPSSTPSGVVPPWDPSANSESTKIPK